ncbi:tetratricopeptide repeat protein [Flexithrix dorotheae]|uniref:tetratricopeptide repeat protein n=1 Tax=Flexithrix dorotheae TaxID=70993 RepID=UPI00036D0F86|nr:tetratricopeptide repeat protein [Flexithrix dorotheae]
MKVKNFISLLSFLIIFQSFNAFSQSSELLDNAQNLIQNSRYEEAILLLAEASKKTPDNAEIYFISANCKINLGKFNEAIQDLEKAVEIKPDYYQAFEELGDLYAQMRNAEKAVENYDNAFATDSNLERQLKYKIDIINILNLVKQQQSVFEHIEIARKLSPDNFDVKFLEAQYYNYIGDYNSAKDILDKIITQVPKIAENEQYFYEIGYAYHYLEEYEKAKEYFEFANGGEFKVKLIEFTPEFYFSLANAYFSIYEYQLSEKFLATTLKLNPSMTEAYDLQKKLASIKAEKAELISITKGEIEASEKDGNFLKDKVYELAFLYHQNGDYEFCMTACDKLIDKNPMDFNAIFLKAACEYQLNKPGSATETLERAVKNPRLNPEKKAQFNFMIGMNYKAAKNLDMAEEAFRGASKGYYRGATLKELESIQKAKQKSSK